MTGIFTLDAFLAITVAFSMLTASYFLMSTQKIDKNEYLYQVALDILTIAEKNGKLARALDADTSGIEEYKALLSKSICFSINIQNSTGSQVFHDDTNCDQSESHVIAKRTVYHNEQFYISSMRVWYK